MSKKSKSKSKFSINFVREYVTYKLAIHVSA